MTRMNAPLAQPVTLTDAQVAQFRELGYCTVPNFFDARAVRAMQATVSTLVAAGRLRNVATTGDGETASTSVFNLQICPVSPENLLTRALPFAPQVAPAIARLLGPCAVHILDQIFLKPARNGAGTNWHTDNHYFTVDQNFAGTGMWIAVHDANRANGTMRIIPGSHRREWQHRRDQGSDHHFTCADLVDESEAVHIELAAGGVLFFNFGIAHATGANTTDHDRAGLAYHFVGCPKPTELPHYTMHAGRGSPWIVGPACSNGRAEWHTDLAAAWPVEVARLAV